MSANLIVNFFVPEFFAKRENALMLHRWHVTHCSGKTYGGYEKRRRSRRDSGLILNSYQHLEHASRPWAMAWSSVDSIGFFILLQDGLEWYLLPVRESHTVAAIGSASAAV